MSVVYRSVPKYPADKVRIGEDGSVQAWHSRWKRWHTLKPATHFWNGVPVLTVKIDDMAQSVAVLVCRAFYGPRPLGNVVFHFPDTNRLNCKASNLRWAPKYTAKITNASFVEAGRKYVELHGMPDQQGSKNSQAVMTEDDVKQARKLRQDGWIMADIADFLGFTLGATASAVQGRRWPHLPGAIKGPTGCPSGRNQGTLNPHSKVDNEIVQEMRSLYARGMTIKELMEQFRLAHTTVWQIVNRRTWSHVPDPPANTSDSEQIVKP